MQDDSHWRPRVGSLPIGEAHGAGQGCVPVLPLDQCTLGHNLARCPKTTLEVGWWLRGFRQASSPVLVQRARHCHVAPCVVCVLGLSQLVVLAVARRTTQFSDFPRKDALDARLPPPAPKHAQSGNRSHGRCLHVNRQGGISTVVGKIRAGQPVCWGCWTRAPVARDLPDGDPGNVRSGGSASQLRRPTLRLGPPNVKFTNWVYSRSAMCMCTCLEQKALSFFSPKAIFPGILDPQWIWGISSRVEGAQNP